MYSPTILHAPVNELHRLRRALFLLVAEIECHALGAILAISSLIFSLPAIGLGRDELQIFLWLAAQIAAASTLAGLVGRYGCRKVGLRWPVFLAVILDFVVLALGLIANLGIVPPWVVFWAELPRLFSFFLTLIYLTNLAEGASEPDIVLLLNQAKRAFLWQFIVWPGVVFTTVGACAAAVALACIVLPLIPLALLGLALFLFFKVVINYSHAIRNLRLAVKVRIKELEEGDLPSSSMGLTGLRAD